MIIIVSHMKIVKQNKNNTWRRILALNEHIKMNNKINVSFYLKNYNRRDKIILKVEGHR